MSVFSTSALAFSMSADAFAASLGHGASNPNPKLKTALKTGLLFGTIEAITPILGWALGLAASSYIAAVDHWIAFIILSLLGAKMIHEGFSKDDGGEDCDPQPKSLLRVAMIAFATSIDALAVGVTLAFIDANIWVSSAAIGAATFIMVTFGMMIGHYASKKLGKRTEAIGGVILIIIGSVILHEHLTAAAV